MNFPQKLELQVLKQKLQLQSLGNTHDRYAAGQLNFIHDVSDQNTAQRMKHCWKIWNKNKYFILCETKPFLIDAKTLNTYYFFRNCILKICFMTNTLLYNNSFVVCCVCATHFLLTNGLSTTNYKQFILLNCSSCVKSNIFQVPCGFWSVVDCLPPPKLLPVKA